MTPCDRFEREGLLQMEQGFDLDEHYSTCAECRRARAAHEKLREGIAAAGRRHQPPVGWQQRVRSGIRTVEDRRWAWMPQFGRPVWVGALATAGVVLAAVALSVFPVRQVGGPVPLGLDVVIETGPGQVRGDDQAQPGDRLTLRASIGSAPHWELRVYRNDRELILRCSTEPPCRRIGDTVEAAVELPAIGRYQAVLLAGAEEPPEPVGNLDTDVDRATSAGLDHALRELRVR